MDTSPHRRGFVNVNGSNLHCLDWDGTGDVLLFLAGRGCNAHHFDDFAPRFVDRFHISNDWMTEEQKTQVMNHFEATVHSNTGENIEQFQRNVPHARIIEMPDRHHFCFIKHEELVYEEMRKFLLE